MPSALSSDTLRLVATGGGVGKTSPIELLFRFVPRVAIVVPSVFVAFLLGGWSLR